MTKSVFRFVIIYIKVISMTMLIRSCRSSSHCRWYHPDASSCNLYNSLEMMHLNLRVRDRQIRLNYHCDVTMCAMASRISSLTIVYSTVYTGTDQRKHQSSMWLAFLCEESVNFPHKWPVTRKMFPFDDVTMRTPKENSLSNGRQVTCPDIPTSAPQGSI